MCEKRIYNLLYEKPILILILLNKSIQNTIHIGIYVNNLLEKYIVILSNIIDIYKYKTLLDVYTNYVYILWFVWKTRLY